MIRLCGLALVLISGCAPPPPAELPLHFPEVPTGAAVSVFPGRLDFGLLPAADRSLTVRNHTHSAVELRSFSFSSSAFSSATPVPMSIPALGSVELTVHASGAGAPDGMLTIDTSAQRIEVPLLANRTAPCLTASQSSIDFGSLELACRARDELITVTNSCPHAVRDVAGSVTSGFVMVVGAPRAELAPGASVTFVVTAALEVPAQPSGAVSVSADVLDGTQIVTVQLSAERTPMRLVVDEYPNPRPMRDVLILLDDSQGLAPFSEAYRVGMFRLAHDLVANQESVRVGVMTTSTAPGELARLRRTSTGQAWLENPTVAEFEAHTALRGTSTGRSSCLEVLHEAFTTRTEVGPMLRPRAFLQVLCITSQADGLEAPATPMIGSLLSLMPHPRGITFVANFIDVPGCSATRDTGVLTTLLELTNGRREEICSPLWWLEDRVVYFGGFRATFFLSERPDQTRAPLEVSVNEVTIPEDGWTYRAENNAVTVGLSYLPAYEQTLRLRYAPSCR